MNTRNIDIKKRLKNNGISYFELAELFGVSEMTIFRKLRKDLDKSEKEEINKAIDEIISKREQ